MKNLIRKWLGIDDLQCRVESNHQLASVADVKVNKYIVSEDEYIGDIGKLMFIVGQATKHINSNEQAYVDRRIEDVFEIIHDRMDEIEEILKEKDVAL